MSAATRVRLQREREAGAVPAPPAAQRDAASTGPAAEILRMQRTVGNRGVGRMLASASAVVQRAEDPAAAPAAPDPVLESVAAVRSFHVEQNLVKEGVGGARKLLDTKVRQRRKELEKYLKQVGEGSKVGQVVRADLEKDLAAILAEPDSRFVSPKMREVIIEAHRALAAKEAVAAEGERRFHRHDALFADPEVVETLAAKGFTPAELKALVSQESGDLLKGESDENVEGPAGIAQIDMKTAQSVGADPADRLAARTAIPMAARILVKKVRALEKGLQAPPSAEDYKKFVYGAYNAGEGTIQEAQRLAKAMGRPGTAWSDLMQPVAGKGIESSPFYGAAKAKLARLGVDPGAKHKETGDYVERILGRLSPAPAAGPAR
jgi:hypothetical protein